MIVHFRLLVEAAGAVTTLEEIQEQKVERLMGQMEIKIFMAM